MPESPVLSTEDNEGNEGNPFSVLSGLSVLSRRGDGLVPSLSDHRSHLHLSVFSFLSSKRIGRLSSFPSLSSVIEQVFSVPSAPSC